MDLAHFLHPFTNYRHLRETGSRIITRADGVHVWDSDGRQILDAMSGLWCVNIGYGRRNLIEAAVAQMEQISYYNSFFETATPPSIELGELIADIAPANFRRVFFTGSGSESIDTMLRIVRRYWQIVQQPDKRFVIGRHRAYHGSTIAGVGLGGMSKMHSQGAYTIDEFHHVLEPDWYRHGRSKTPEEFGREAAAELEKKILELGPENVAAFVGEPIQGAGGVIIPPAGYWPEINRICKTYDVLLVADEVITGFGRIGHWFGTEHYGIAADILTVAKGLSSGYLPIGGVLVSDRVADELVEVGEIFTHGFTYSGHPVCCAVAIENIRTMIVEDLVERTRNVTAPCFGARWSKLADHPLVGDCRVEGMLAAVELARDRDSHEPFDEDLGVGTFVRDSCIERGVMVRAIGDIVVAAPPLILSEAETETVVQVVRTALDATVERFL